MSEAVFDQELAILALLSGGESGDRSGSDARRRLATLMLNVGGGTGDERNFLRTTDDVVGVDGAVDITEGVSELRAQVRCIPK
jgi:hypothetical protein